MRKIRRGDEVEVISGRNKGQRGTVRINMIDEDKVVVEGVNIVTLSFLAMISASF